MVRSMTSFGRSSSEEGKKRFFTVEMKSVNSRYLDVNIRMPKSLISLEEEIKNVFPLTINEWLWLDHILNAQMRTFEDMNAARLYKIAKDEEWANKSAATAQPSSH